MKMALFTATLAVGILCGAASSGQEPRTAVFDFEDAAEGTLPSGFQTGMTGTWKATEWSIRKISGTKVLVHEGYWNEDPDGVFPVCWVTNSNARDLTVTVRLLPVRPPSGIPGAVHDGAGLLIRFKDPDNYYLLRAVPHETRVRFYKVEKGKRTTLAGKSLTVTVDAWHELKLRARGSAFTASFDGRELFSVEDKTFREGGAFGLWSKPNNVTYFADLKAEIVN